MIRHLWHIVVWDTNGSAILCFYMNHRVFRDWTRWKKLHFVWKVYDHLLSTYIKKSSVSLRMQSLVAWMWRRTTKQTACANSVEDRSWDINIMCDWYQRGHTNSSALTHGGRVTHMHVNTLGHRWTRFSAPNHYLNQSMYDAGLSSI